MRKKELRGVIAMLVTPFDKSEDIDFGALRAEFDWCVEQGARGIVMTASIGEFAVLSPEERRKCFEVGIEQAAKHADKSLFMIATSAATHTREVVDYARFAKGLGYDAMQLVPPYYWVPDQTEVYRHFELAAKTGLPIVVYNNPRLSKVDMSREFIGRLADIPGVIAIKETKTAPDVDLEPLFEIIGGRIKIFTTFRVFTTGLLLGSSGGFIHPFALPACVKIWKGFYYGGQVYDIRTMINIQTLLNQVFPRGSEGNLRHIGTTKMAASLVTGIPMGSPRAPYLLPDKKFEVELQQRLPILQEFLKRV